MPAGFDPTRYFSRKLPGPFIKDGATPRMAFLKTGERHNGQTLSPRSDQSADSGVSGLGIADPETIDGINSAMLIVVGRMQPEPLRLSLFQ